LQFIDGECRKLDGENEVGVSMMTSSEGPLLSLASGPPNLKTTTAFMSEGHISYYTIVWGPDILRNVFVSVYVTFYQINTFLLLCYFFIIDKIASRAGFGQRDVVWRPMINDLLSLTLQSRQCNSYIM